MPTPPYTRNIWNHYCPVIILPQSAVDTSANSRQCPLTYENDDQGRQGRQTTVRLLTYTERKWNQNVAPEIGTRRRNQTEKTGYRCQRNNSRSAHRPVCAHWGSTHPGHNCHSDPDESQCKSGAPTTAQMQKGTAVPEIRLQLLLKLKCAMSQQAHS